MSQTAMQDVGGGGSLLTGAILYAINEIQLADINDFIIIMTALAGFVWIIYRVIGQRLTNKGTELDNKIKRKQIEKDSTNSPD
tara:strand:- start:370 stop:618 length:249 start_codon:yes stop_codon:yes gene_type:complete